MGYQVISQVLILSCRSPFSNLINCQHFGLLLIGLVNDLLSKTSKYTTTPEYTHMTENVLRYANVSSCFLPSPKKTLHVNILSPAKVPCREIDKVDCFVPPSSLPSLQ